MKDHRSPRKCRKGEDLAAFILLVIIVAILSLGFAEAIEKKQRAYEQATADQLADASPRTQ